MQFSIGNTIIALCEPDEKWKQMKAIYDLCVHARVIVPEEVEAYFNYNEPPDTQTVNVTSKLRLVTDYSNPQYYTLKLFDLPDNTTALNFENLW